MTRFNIFVTLMKILEKDLPSFLRNFNYTKENDQWGDIDPEKHHKKLIAAIKGIYMMGYTYEEALQIKQIKKAADFIRFKFREDQNYPDAKNLVQFVYTQGKGINILAPWVKFNYMLPFAVLEYTAMNYSKNKQVSLFNLASYLFTVILLYEKGKNQGNDSRLFLKPSLIRKAAGIKSYVAERKYGTLLGLNYEMLKVSFAENLFRQHLILSGGDVLLNKFNSFYEQRTIDYYPTKPGIKELLDSGLLLNSRTLRTLNTNFISSISWSNKENLNHPTLNNNPYLRAGLEEGEFIIYCLSKLLNFEMIFLSLYRSPDHKVKFKPFIADLAKSYKAVLLNINQKRTPVEKRVGKFISNRLRLYRAPEPLEAPYLYGVESADSHFGDIKELSKKSKLKTITEHGILVDTKVLQSMLLKKENEKRHLEDQKHNGLGAAYEVDTQLNKTEYHLAISYLSAQPKNFDAIAAVIIMS